MYPRPNRQPGLPFSDFPIDQVGNKSPMVTHGTPSRYSLVIEGLEGYWAHVNRCNSNRVSTSHSFSSQNWMKNARRNRCVLLWWRSSIFLNSSNALFLDQFSSRRALLILVELQAMANTALRDVCIRETAVTGGGEHLWLLDRILCWASSNRILCWNRRVDWIFVLSKESVQLIVVWWLLQDKKKEFLTFVAGQGLHVGFVHPK